MRFFTVVFLRTVETPVPTFITLAKRAYHGGFAAYITRTKCAYHTCGVNISRLHGKHITALPKAISFSLRTLQRAKVFSVGVDGLAAARSPLGSNSPPDCYSIPRGRFATSTTRFAQSARLPKAISFLFFGPSRRRSLR